MFSSDILLNYVFADENDTYYRDNLLKFTLDQLLWTKLKDNYSEVLFLDSKDGNYRYWSFKQGEKRSDIVKKSFLGVQGPNIMMNQKKCVRWLVDSLSEQSGIAIVCTLYDFCELCNDLGKDFWGKLERNRQRRGILVLKVPIVIEKSQTLFLTSRAFEVLDERAVLDLRTDNLLNMYDYLLQSKDKGCIFLNEFNYENIKGVLTHVMMHDPEKMISEEILEKCINYLVWYFSDSSSYQRHKLFRQRRMLEGFLFRELYQELSNKTTWDNLIKYAIETKCEIVAYKKHVHMIRDRDSYTGRCMRYELPETACNLDIESADVSLAGMLYDIRKKLIEPKNKEDNAVMVDYLGKFYMQLKSCEDRDIHSLRFILEAILYGVEHLSLSEYDELEKAKMVLEQYIKIISISGQYYQMEYRIQNSAGRQSTSKFFKMQMDQLYTTAENFRVMIEKLQEMLNSTKFDEYLKNMAKSLELEKNNLERSESEKDKQRDTELEREIIGYQKEMVEEDVGTEHTKAESYDAGAVFDEQYLRSITSDAPI